MTTTDFIKLLTENEFGGATGRPREVMFETDDEIFNTDGVEVIGSGDGLFTELYLSLPSAKRKVGKWIRITKDGSWSVYVCSLCNTKAHLIGYDAPSDYCHGCGAKMETEG